MPSGNAAHAHPWRCLHNLQSDSNNAMPMLVAPQPAPEDQTKPELKRRRLRPGQGDLAPPVSRCSTLLFGALPRLRQVFRGASTVAAFAKNAGVGRAPAFLANAATSTVVDGGFPGRRARIEWRRESERSD